MLSSREDYILRVGLLQKDEDNKRGQEDVHIFDLPVTFSGQPRTGAAFEIFKSCVLHYETIVMQTT